MYGICSSSCLCPYKHSPIILCSFNLYNNINHLIRFVLKTCPYHPFLGWILATSILKQMIYLRALSAYCMIRQQNHKCKWLFHAYVPIARLIVVMETMFPSLLKWSWCWCSVLPIGVGFLRKVFSHSALNLLLHKTEIELMQYNTSTNDNNT